MRTDPEMGSRHGPRLCLVFGARANYSRMAEIVERLMSEDEPPLLVNTGQHWSPELVGHGFGGSIMSRAVNLDTRSSDIDVLYNACKRYFNSARDDIGVVAVYGDTNSAVGAAKAAADIGIPLVHIEAGFHTYDGDGIQIKADSPEEENRSQLDKLANCHIPFTVMAHDALVSDGAVRGYIEEPTGHPLAQRFLMMNERYATIPPTKGTGLVTVHRYENLSGEMPAIVDILRGLSTLSDMRWVFPCTPGTSNTIKLFGLTIPANVTMLPPQPHESMVRLLAGAEMVVSDSAGLTLEAALAGKKLVIPREFIEFPEILTYCVLSKPDGIPRVVGSVRGANHKPALVEAVRDAYTMRHQEAASRIVSALKRAQRYFA